jgi:2-polyprenyl-3-methyl-5-hydroxy-6-metoxy-1,4-benzoquinol methylase
MKRDPWFTIDGLWQGHRNLKSQIQGLGPLTAEIKGGTVLDIGCAEGLIGKYLIEHGGAASVDGVEVYQPRIIDGEKLCAGLPMRFFRVDLEYFGLWEGENAGQLAGSYDAVLMLSIIHKLRRPREFLGRMAELSKRFIVLRLPAPIIDDVRSNNVPFDVRAFLAGKGYTLTSEAESGVKEWLGIFERT